MTKIYSNSLSFSLNLLDWVALFHSPGKYFAYKSIIPESIREYANCLFCDVKLPLHIFLLKAMAEHIFLKQMLN